MQTAERVAAVFNGEYTIESPKGGHRTIKIRTQKEDAKFAPGKRIISLFTGTDNTHYLHYTGFGFVKDHQIVVWRSKRGGNFDAIARMFWGMITGNAYGKALEGAGYTLQESCTCIRCNRKLTNPESIRTGIGPECAGRQ